MATTRANGISPGLGTESDGTTTVRAPLDLAKVEAWLSAQLGRRCSLSAKQFSGQSNRRTDGRVGRAARPAAQAGRQAAAWHDVEREHRAMFALQRTAVPVPRMLAVHRRVGRRRAILRDGVRARPCAARRDAAVARARRAHRAVAARGAHPGRHARARLPIDRAGAARQAGWYASRQLEQWARQFHAVDGFVRERLADARSRRR